MSIKDLSLDDGQPPILKECTFKGLLQNNRINDLPDDILTRILSLLTLKEAGSTSVLSKRWRHVWAYVPSLNFDNPKVSQRFRVTEIEECKYLRWVDQVMSSYKAHIVDEFRVQCGLPDILKDNVDNWLRFAMEKRVTRLELYISPSRKSSFRKLPNNFPILSSGNRLTSLVFSGVEVSGEFLEILWDCQTLELLSVSFSWSLENLKIDGPLNLKSLRIRHCNNIKHLEISAPNLISFHYAGPKLLSWPLKSTPKLTEVEVEGFYGSHLMSDFSDLSSCMSQIEVLRIWSVTSHKCIKEVFPVCPRLKRLNIGISPDSDEFLFGLSSLIKGCPVLHKLVLEFITYDGQIRMDMTRKRIKAKAFRHNNLKILEISGFSGSLVELRFVKYLIKTAVSLEKIIIKANSIIDPDAKVNVQTHGREEAKRLSGILKPGTELEVRGVKVRSKRMKAS